MSYLDRSPRDPLVVGARRLVSEVWRLVDDGTVGSRSPAGDAALDLRDTLDPSWQPERRRLPLDPKAVVDALDNGNLSTVRDLLSEASPTEVLDVVIHAVLQTAPWGPEVDHGLRPVRRLRHLLGQGT